MWERFTGEWRYLGLSLLLHLLIVLALVVTRILPHSSEPVPAPIVQATLVQQTPRLASSRNPPAPKVEMAQARTDTFKAQKVQAEEARRQAEAQRKAQAEAQAKADAQAKAEAQRKAQAEAQAKADAQAKAEAQRKAQEDAKRQEEARRQAMLKEELASEEQGLRKQSQMRELALYVQAIRQKVERNWIKPESASSKIDCQVRVVQLPNGEVVSAQVVKSCGSDVLDRSVEQAVLRASPLPPPPTPDLFQRELIFEYKPGV